ncbi:MAG: hypothetical protein H6729_08270 [Deltaproteobacteria bacterium]|nr:hypothetical protein [Deltaproteobacteria bacterium]
MEIRRVPLPPDSLLVAAPAGNTFALFNEAENSIRVSSNLRDWRSIPPPPLLSHLFPEPLERVKQERIQLYWMDNTNLVIRRSNFASTALACAELDIQERRWKRADSGPACPALADITGDLLSIVRVKNDVFAVETSAEGVTGISLVHVNRSAMDPNPTAELTLGNGVQGRLERYQAVGKTFIVSSHVLTEEPARLSGDCCWQLYAWNITNGALSLMRAGLPQEARLRPEKNDEWLWPTKDGQLCLGDPDTEAKAKCATLPSNSD